MIEYKLGEVEMKFSDIIWENEPLTSGELVTLSLKELNWKKSTTYTVLRKLCEKGIFQNEYSTVTSLVSKDDYISIQSGMFIDETFSGSLPKFLASFSKRNKLSAKEVEEIQKIIDQHKEV
ncbi:MAG: BlaI/MecI/CopY family transcriptional regulator [Clostridia bacterium]